MPAVKPMSYVWVIFSYVFLYLAMPISY